MATQKPIATISYNTEAFLREKLDTWYSAHIIQSWQYIKHKGEDGDKDHIHLRIEPNKRIDPMELRDELREFQMGNDKPLGCLGFRPSKEEDWLLYAVHDKDYLSRKYSADSKEKIPYSWSDIVVPDDYDIETVFLRARATLAHAPASLMSRLKSGASASSLVSEGESPFVVNAVLKALSTSEYSALCAQYDALETRLFAVLEAVQKAGFDVVEDKHGEYKVILHCEDVSPKYRTVNLPIIEEFQDD